MMLAHHKIQFVFPSKSNCSLCRRAGSSTRYSSRFPPAHHHGNAPVIARKPSFPPNRIILDASAPAPAVETIRVSLQIPAHLFQQETHFPCPSKSNTFSSIMPAHRFQDANSNFPSSNSCWRTGTCSRHNSRSPPIRGLILRIHAGARYNSEFRFQFTFPGIGSCWCTSSCGRYTSRPLQFQIMLEHRHLHEIQFEFPPIRVLELQLQRNAKLVGTLSS